MTLYFSPQSEKYLNSKGSEKIKKLANKLIIFTNSNNVMMVSIIVKEVSWTISHLESTILNYEVYSIFLGTRTNRGNRYRKIYLCIKRCLKRKKNLQVMEGDIGGYPIPQYRKKKWQIPKYRVENRLNTDTAYFNHIYNRLRILMAASI